MRIPDQVIHDLKRNVDLAELVRAAGVELARHGKDLIGLCPFHDDNEPSLVVTPDKNLWHCLGACQTGGSVIDWVMKAHGVKFRLAVEMLREGSVSLATSKPGSTKKSTVQKLESVVVPYAGAQKQLRQVIDYYHATLKESPEALEYLERRGLQSAELVDHFHLGFSNRTLGYRLPAKNREAGGDIRNTLKEIGIMRESGHELFQGSLVIPIIDAQGVVQEVYGRRIGKHLRRERPNHLYLPGPHRGILNEAALAASKEIILCESVIDALTFWCAGFRNVTCSYGVEGFTAKHLETFKRYGTERVLIAYDRDEAGDKAAAKLSEQLVAEGMTCFRVVFPRNMDANDYALKVQPAAKSLGIALRKAVWLGGVEKSAPTSESIDTAIATPASTSEAETELSQAEAASPLPAPPSVAVNAEVEAEQVVMRFGDRRWRIRGLEKNMSYDQLRVNVLCSKADTYHVDTFDLYSARHRAAYLKEAAAELGCEERVLKKDLGRVLLKLEQLQDEQIKRAREPKNETPTMTPDERNEALELLRSPDLLDRILADFERCGVVGEVTNKLMGYLAAVSRKLEDPLAVILQSSSAAGKSLLMDAILAFLPEEERVQYSAMTGQSLFYMGETDLKHKVLAIVEEEGAERASYALKLLQSEGELTIASTGKDPTSGRLVTHEYRVEGPVMIFLTTTAIEIDDELLNRCLVLTVDEDRRQTRAIHDQQRESQTLEGLLARHDKATLLRIHQNAQRLLSPLLVANPFATRLTFLDDRTRTRRDHMKYLTLIRSIALLHQHQREHRTIERNGKTLRYIEATLEDIAVANALAEQVFGRSFDELPPQTRRLLKMLGEMVDAGCEREGVDREDYRFTRRQVREHTGWGATQTRVHLDRLVELEYVLAQGGGAGRRFVYALAHNGEVLDRPAFDGLIDPEALDSTDSGTTWRGLAATWRGKLATWRGGGGHLAGSEKSPKSSDTNSFDETWRVRAESTLGGSEKNLPLSVSAVP